MYKCLIVFALFLGENYAQAGDLPNSLYQIELDKPIHEIKNSSKTRMKGLYSIKPNEKQLSEPFTRLLVKVNKKTNTIKQVVGEADISETSCINVAKRLKEKYEKLFLLQFKELKHQGDIFYTTNKDKRFFLVGCENKKKTILRVSLSSI